MIRSKTRRNPSDYEILMAEAIGRLPNVLVRYWNDFVPNRRRAHAARCKAIAEPIARDLVARKLSALQAGETGTDVMSRLGSFLPCLHLLVSCLTRCLQSKRTPLRILTTALTRKSFSLNCCELVCRSSEPY